MRHETATSADVRTDWKGLGYLISIASVFLLAIVAWPRDGEPGWYLPILLAGIATSILGMGCRYKAHLDQQRELQRTKSEARRR